MTFTNDVNFVLVPIQVCFLECNIFGIGQFWYFFFFFERETHQTLLRKSNNVILDNGTMGGGTSSIYTEKSEIQKVCLTNLCATLLPSLFT